MYSPYSELSERDVRRSHLRSDGILFGFEWEVKLQRLDAERRRASRLRRCRGMTPLPLKR